MLASGFCSSCAQGVLLTYPPLRRGRVPTARSLVVLPSPPVAPVSVVVLPTTPIPAAIHPPPVITLSPRRPTPAPRPVLLPAAATAVVVVAAVMVVVPLALAVAIPISVPVAVVLSLLAVAVAVTLAVTPAAARRLPAVAAVVVPARRGARLCERSLRRRPRHSCRAAWLTTRRRRRVGAMPVVVVWRGNSRDGGALRRLWVMTVS